MIFFWWVCSDLYNGILGFGSRRNIVRVMLLWTKMMKYLSWSLMNRLLLEKESWESSFLGSLMSTRKASTNGVVIIVILSLFKKLIFKWTENLIQVLLCSLNFNSSYVEKEVKKNMAVTQFEAVDARRCFPCWDEPALKVYMKVTF